MNRGFKAAFWMEALKARRTRILPISACFFIFIGVMMGMLMYLSVHPEIASRSSTVSMKTSFLQGSGWNAYLSLFLQVILTVGVIGAGVVTSWVFGREFSDRSLKDLLALPVTRAQIVISKLVIVLIWSLFLSFIVLLAGMLTGLAISLPGREEAELASFFKSYALCALLNTLLITPVAFVASAGRGYLLPISFVILIMIITQLLFVGLPALSIYFPWALPALISGVAAKAMPSPGFACYLIFFLTVAAGFAGTLVWWRYADQK